MGADRPQDPPEVQIPHIHFGSQITHLEVSTKTNRPLNRTLVVRDGITPVMRLEQDQATGLAKNIQIGDHKYQLGYDGKPRIENVGGQNLVGGVEPSLHLISYPDGKKQTFDFAVTEKMLPSLKITDTNGKERMIVWGLDGRMLQDGVWSYMITPSKVAGANAAIERTNHQNQKESWFKDDPNGKETTIALDGTKTERTWFTSGLLAGKTRKEITLLNNKIVNQNNWKYDEKGLLIRSIQDGTARDYDAMGRQIKISQNGRSINYTYDSDGFITAINKTETHIP